MKNESLFRSYWYISKQPFNQNSSLCKDLEKPLMEINSPEYFYLIEKMKSQKHIRKAIFVFKNGEFFKKYDGIVEAEKDLKISGACALKSSPPGSISHDTINSNIEKNTIYKGFKFSLHRIK